MMRIIKQPFISFREDSVKEIVFAEFSVVVKIDLVVAEEIVTSRLAFTRNEPHYLIADVSKIREITSEAKEYFQKKDGGLQNILGAAIIASNPLSALIANIFVKSSSIGFPAKFFSNNNDAYRWIIEQRAKLMAASPNLFSKTKTCL